MPAAIAFPPQLHVFVRDWLSSNNVVLRSRDGHVVIDTGYVRHAPLTLALLGVGIWRFRTIAKMGQVSRRDLAGGGLETLQPAHVSLSLRQGPQQESIRRLPPPGEHGCERAFGILVTLADF